LLDEFLRNHIHRKCTLNSIKYSDADIFIISGVEGRNTFNKLLDGFNLELITDKNPKTGMKEYNNTICDGISSWIWAILQFT
jgi:hypothetical protein